MQISCEERNRITSLNFILKLTNLRINYNNQVEYGNVSVFKALNYFWARNKVLIRRRILSQCCNFRGFCIFKKYLTNISQYMKYR